MAYQFIDRDECIGDSLVKINNNSANFDTRIINLSSTVTANNQDIRGQVFGSGSILKASFYSFTDQTTRSGDLRNYHPATNGAINVVSTQNNSKFLVTMNASGYTSSSNGANIGINRTINFVTTRLLGLDGNAGDAWAGTSNGYNGAYNISRTVLDAPSVLAGTNISYTMLLGHWSAGTSYLNYPGHTLTSSITVFEIG